jgi:hypothetical protein
MYWTDSYGFIELNITKAQAHMGHHQGQCDQDIEDLRRVPSIKKQLDRLDPDRVREVLRDYGAWDDDELSDHDANLDRLLWIACGDIVEGNV